MAQDNTALLAELEQELADLQTTIAVLKRRMGLIDATQEEPSSIKTFRIQRSQGKPYLGMSILDAARKHLSSVEEPMTPSDIAAALKEGGVHSRSEDFGGIVRTTLHKFGTKAGIQPFGGGKWGLADWRPGGRRGSEGAGE